MAEQRYRVVDRLEAGGMAEVFRGEALSVQGFKKQVAIKRVLPHLAQNKNFIAMFLDEARLGARLNHANIVTVFDIGAADNTYFIVMEFVDGCNLKAVIEHFRQLGRRLPVKECVFMCMEACRGLSYAHELEDEDGAPLNIVHRDISPPNILLSKRGEVKVTDFGLAKATTQLEKTDPGVVKGKFSYLSPEAALGEGVDARADVFGLGIVLWEMLAGRRLFLGETDYQTVQLVQQTQIPQLSKLNPEVPAALEEVLAQALARDPRQRFESAQAFGDALAGFLFSHQLKVTSFDVANLVKEVVERRQKNAKPQEASIIDRLIQEELLRFTSIDEVDGDGLAEGQSPISPDEIGEGAAPLADFDFENPAEWFSDDAEVSEAVAVTTAGAESSEPGWRESGLVSEGESLADLLEAEEIISSRPPAPEPAAEAPVPPPPPAPGPREDPPDASSGGSSRWLLYAAVALLIVVLAVVGAMFALR
jgi:serine/threonine protein kinase